MKYDELKKLFDISLEKNAKAQPLLEKFRSGKADLHDTAELSNLVSSILSCLIKSNLEELDDPEGSAKRLLREYYEMINSILADTQQSLDDKTGLHIEPAKAPYPRQRVDQLAHSLIDPTVSAEVRARRAGNGIENTARSFHDDYVEANVKRRSRAGVKCYIVRQVHGPCCDWCSKLAGRYEYGSEPDDVYRRHDNCDCTTIFENGRERQNVWSKKTWTVDEKLKLPVKPKVFSYEEAQALQDEKLSKFRVDISGESGIIKEKQYQMADEKFINYSLDPIRQPDKAEAFRKALGYTQENYKELKQKILDSLDEKNFVEKGDKGHGMLYEHISDIVGANNKTAKVLTAWIQEEDHKRLVSVYVKKNKKE